VTPAVFADTNSKLILLKCQQCNIKYQKCGTVKFLEKNSQNYILVALRVYSAPTRSDIKLRLLEVMNEMMLARLLRNIIK